MSQKIIKDDIPTQLVMMSTTRKRSSAKYYRENRETILKRKLLMALSKGAVPGLKTVLRHHVSHHDLEASWNVYASTHDVSAAKKHLFEILLSNFAEGAATTTPRKRLLHVVFTPRSERTD